MFLGIFHIELHGNNSSKGQDCGETLLFVTTSVGILIEDLSEPSKIAARIAAAETIKEVFCQSLSQGDFGLIPSYETRDFTKDRHENISMGVSAIHEQERFIEPAVIDCLPREQQPLIFDRQNLDNFDAMTVEE